MLPRYQSPKPAQRGAAGSIALIEVLHEHNFVLRLVVEELINFRFHQHQSKPTRAQSLFLADQPVFDGLPPCVMAAWSRSANLNPGPGSEFDKAACFWRADRRYAPCAWDRVCRPIRSHSSAARGTPAPRRIAQLFGKPRYRVFHEIFQPGAAIQRTGHQQLHPFRPCGNHLDRRQVDFLSSDSHTSVISVCRSTGFAR